MKGIDVNDAKTTRSVPAGFLPHAHDPPPPTG
jgi:hypothetical protein